MVSKHLSELNANYSDHMWFSMSLGCKLAEGSVKAFLHALFPDMYVTSTTQTVIDIQNELDDAKLNGIRSKL